MSPYAGVTSHHLLVSPLIDRWFSELKRLKPDIRTFVILSPDHFNNGKARINTTSAGFDTCYGKIHSNKKYTETILNSMNIKDDPDAFNHEHGILDIVPFIAKYFPDAKVVAISLDQINRSNKELIRLSEILYSFMEKDEKIFLLISADFSHRCNLLETYKNDSNSLARLMKFEEQSVNGIYSDNIAALYVLFHIAQKTGRKKMYLMCNTNSFDYSKKDDKDITSYIFSFIY